jgi:hypothetical protein
MRVVTVICGLLLLAVFAGTVLVVAEAHQDQVINEIPTPEASLTPGQVHTDEHCTISVFDGRYSYCQNGRLTVTMIDRVIKYVTIDTHDRGLSIGQVLNEWGPPIGADYTRYGTIAVYWADRYVHLLPDDTFGPGTRVNSVTYSLYRYSTQMHKLWRGFMSNERSN